MIKNLVHSRGSLRQRLVLLAGIVLLLAMAAAWYGLSNLFEQHVERRVQFELTNHLNQLIVSLQRDKNGEYRLKKPLSDPRFLQPFSGLYWQIIGKDGVVLKSRSLWDFTLDLDNVPRNINGLHEYTIAGPENHTLFSVVQNVRLDTGSGEKWYLMTVSLDHGEISRAVQAFARELALALALLATIFILALVVQVWIGLSPLKQMQREIRELQDGKRQKLTGTYPEEIAPVVREINEFITMQEISTERGRRRASDLAHGFKTPLTILAATARQLEEHGARDSAALLRQQITSMNQHVERELARAKIDITPHRLSQTIPVRTAIEKIIATLRHVPRERPVDWRLDIPSRLAVRMEQGDFTEICGNLLENAHKWARGTITVSARPGPDDTVIIEIGDDGPGVPEHQFELMLQRGKRLDETVQGNGLGLAIVNDIMAAYKYRLEPYHNRQGGLGMRLIMTAGDA